MGIKNEIDDFVCSTATESVTEPIKGHFCRPLRFEHECLQFEEVFVVDDVVDVLSHVPIIRGGVATATQVVPLLELSRRCGSSDL